MSKEDLGLTYQFLVLAATLDILVITQEHYKAFLSYSQENSEHNKQVVNLLSEISKNLTSRCLL